MRISIPSKRCLPPNEQKASVSGFTVHPAAGKCLESTCLVCHYRRLGLEVEGWDRRVCLGSARLHSSNMTATTLRFDSIRKPQSCPFLESEAATTVPSSPRQGEDFSPYLAEAGLEVCEVLNEVPEEHLQTLLDTLPPFRLDLFAGLPAIARLFGARENGPKKEEAAKQQGKTKKRQRSIVAAPAAPVKLPKLEIPPASPPTERRAKGSHAGLYDLLEAKKQEAASRAREVPSQKTQLRRKLESTEDLYASLGLLSKR